MRLIGIKNVLKLSLAVFLPALTVLGQQVRIELGKQINRIPKGCESVAPASVDGQIDMRALLSEASCKGAGDMLTEYSNLNERRPAVYVEMTRLREGIWLPRMARINAADYPKLFDGITADSTFSYTKYIRFSTELRDVKVNPPDNY